MMLKCSVCGSYSYVVNKTQKGFCLECGSITKLSKRSICILDEIIIKACERQIKMWSLLKVPFYKEKKA